MKTIGITGGVGAGKSAVLDYLKAKYNAIIIKADELAYELESPGHSCYDQIVELLGQDILDSNGYIIKNEMARRIFSNGELLTRVNNIIHPEVKKYILEVIKQESDRNIYDYFILEAALLIEEGYDKILDELWYVRADESIRATRLRETRNYTDEKIQSIFESQKSDEEFSKVCKVIIDNSRSLEDTYKQIDAAIMQ